MNYLIKKALEFKKPKIIFITGQGKLQAGDFIIKTIEKKLSIKNILFQLPNIFDALNFDVLLMLLDLRNEKDLEKIKYLAKVSCQPIFLATNTVKVCDGLELLSDEKEADFAKLITEKMPENCFYIINSDDKYLQKIEKSLNFKNLKFGFSDKSDYKVTDVNITDENTNFKLNYKGSIIPFWLKKEKNKVEKEKIFSALSAICVGTVLGLNIVEISENLKN